MQKAKEKNSAGFSVRKDTLERELVYMLWLRSINKTEDYDKMENGDLFQFVPFDCAISKPKKHKALSITTQRTA